jgi:hypothetical protein
MSNIFLRNNLKDLFTETTSTTVNLPEYITIVDAKKNQRGGATVVAGTTTPNSESGSKDVNQLISMLTSDTNDVHNFSDNSTSTQALETK